MPGMLLARSHVSDLRSCPGSLVTEAVSAALIATAP